MIKGLLTRQTQNKQKTKKQTAIPRSKNNESNRSVQINERNLRLNMRETMNSFVYLFYSQARRDGTPRGMSEVLLN